MQRQHRRRLGVVDRMLSALMKGAPTRPSGSTYALSNADAGSAPASAGTQCAAGACARAARAIWAISAASYAQNAVLIRSVLVWPHDVVLPAGSQSPNSHALPVRPEEARVRSRR